MIFGQVWIHQRGNQRPFKWKDRKCIPLYMSFFSGRQPIGDSCLQWVNVQSNVQICSTSNLNYFTSQWKSFQRMAMFLPGISNVNAEYRTRNVVFHILISLSPAIYWLDGAFTKVAGCMKLISIFMLRTTSISLTLYNFCENALFFLIFVMNTGQWCDDWYSTM